MAAIFHNVIIDGTCRFIVFDFDNHEKGAEATDFANVDSEWHKEVDALRKICEINGIKPLVERSRPGRGAHVWIFFQKAIPASSARNFGFLLLDKGSESINLKSFHYYDRMYPSQDVASSIGNLIALPLQGQALKNGNSAFVDGNWNAYPDQWDILFNRTEKLSIDDFEKIYGAEELQESDIRHKIMIIKINKLYQKGMTEEALYDSVRGIWRASLERVKTVEYVFGVYNSLIVAVYKPTTWYVCKEALEKLPKHVTQLTSKTENRVFFVDKGFENHELMDKAEKFYLYKSIASLKVNQSAQNPITYLEAKE